MAHWEQRYQHYCSKGLVWTDWFIPVFPHPDNKIQYKDSHLTLKNEYRLVEDGVQNNNSSNS